MAKKTAKKKSPKSVSKKAVKKVAKKVIKKTAKKVKRQPAKMAKTAKKTSPKANRKPAKRTVVKTAVSMPTVTLLPSKAPKIGEEVPNFSIPSTAGQDFVLKNYQGKKVLLYFYPKDSTPGCTIEAYEFSGLQDQFKSQNVEVFGISRNSLLSHDKFRDEQSLTIDLLSDPDETACKIFDVIKMKNMYGNRVMGVERSTFLLDEKGRLLKEWRKVKAEGHAKEVLAAVKEIKE